MTVLTRFGRAPLSDPLCLAFQRVHVNVCMYQRVRIGL